MKTLFVDWLEVRDKSGVYTDGRRVIVRITRRNEMGNKRRERMYVAIGASRRRILRMLAGM